jgi:hypothetical protein
MIYSIYPKYDTTIYEKTESLNSGTDSIIEITHETVGQTDRYNSRILMKFDLTEVQDYINSGKIPSGSVKYYLQLRTAEVREIPQEYSVYAYPVSSSWTNGTGKYYNTPNITDGVSWKYRFSKINGTEWNIPSLPATSSYYSTIGGGTWWNTGSVECSQSFSYESSDIFMDVTKIVNKWVTGSGGLNNDGMILKFGDDMESSYETNAVLKFFSTDSNTIYVPKLHIVWDDSSFVTGSLTKVNSDDTLLNVKLKKYYSQDEKSKIRIYGNSRYPQKQYTTQSYYVKNYYLPSSSYYEIRDAHTDEIIIPFNTTGSKISCDGTSSYFNIWMNSLQPERFYRVVVKTETDDNVEIFDNNYYFKVTR